MLFITLRQRTQTCQSLLVVDATKSKQMLKWATALSPESLVRIYAKVEQAPELIKSCSVQQVELKIEQVYSKKLTFIGYLEDLNISQIFAESVADRLPFTIEDASRPPAEITEESGFSPIHLDTRLNNRVIDLRTVTNQSIFRVQAGVSRFFRSFLDSKGFTEIHTPKLNGGASEGGANVFEVPYFKGLVENN